MNEANNKLRSRPPLAAPPLVELQNKLQQDEPKKNRYNAIASSFVSLLITVVFCIFALAPFLFMLMASLKPGADMFRNGININIDPKIMSLKNYSELFTGKEGLYLQWYKNSLLITFLQTVIAIFLSAMVGYGLAMYRFKGRNAIFVAVLVVMMVPVEILILPLYQLTTTLHIIDTIASVILPFAVPPVAVFFFRQYAVGLPKDLLDSGRIDGCSEYGIYFKLMMPLMKPAFGAMVILQAMFSWNNVVWPLIALRTNEMLTLPIGLASLMTPYGNNYDMLMSGAVLSVIPIVIVFLFNQKSFISGLTVGAIKG